MNDFKVKVKYNSGKSLNRFETEFILNAENKEDAENKINAYMFSNQKYYRNPKIILISIVD